MKQFTIRRSIFAPDGIFGELLERDGQPLAVTLEHSFSSGGDCAPLIPAGTYTLNLGEHELHEGPPFKTYEFPPFISPVDYQRHEQCLLHRGNLNRDSVGCVLVGQHDGSIGGQRAIVNSVVALDAFLAVTGFEDQIEMTVQDAQPDTAPQDAPAGDPDPTSPQEQVA